VPSNIDAAGNIYNVIASGLVVSGNSYITVQTSLLSGQAASSLGYATSGKTDAIYIRLVRDQTEPMTGGVYNAIADNIVLEVYNLRVYQGGDTNVAMSGLRTRVNDLKVTMASGSFTGMSRPMLISESWPLPQEKWAKATLIYRTRYLL
jgi:hypothetical protein